MCYMQKTEMEKFLFVPRFMGGKFLTEGTRAPLTRPCRRLSDRPEQILGEKLRIGRVAV